VIIYVYRGISRTDARLRCQTADRRTEMTRRRRLPGEHHNIWEWEVTVWPKSYS